MHAREYFSNIQNPELFVWKAEQGAKLYIYVHARTGEPLGAQDFAYAQWKAQVNGSPVLSPSLVPFEVNPLSEETELIYELPQGWSGLYLWNKTDTSAQADAYIPRAVFHPDLERTAELIGTPGTTPAAITVGSYDWNDKFDTADGIKSLKDGCGNYPMALGRLSCYSSPGFSRSIGVIKPDITAPGE
jgi:hypothetical protein